MSKSMKCPTPDQLREDVLSTMTWNEIAMKYGYTSSRFLEKKARDWGLPDKTRKYSNGFKYKTKSHKRIYCIWHDMKRRCYQPQNKRYGSYGGRGISVCDEWLTSFQAFFDWSMANGYSDNLTLDRKDGSKGYSPENCRWADVYQQANNRSNNHLVTYNGQTKTMKQWSNDIGISYYVLRARLQRGWDVEAALMTPVGGVK